jgi:hypothetical protein
MSVIVDLVATTLEPLIDDLDGSEGDAIRPLVRPLLEVFEFSPVTVRLVPQGWSRECLQAAPAAERCQSAQSAHQGLRLGYLTDEAQHV